MPEIRTQYTFIFIALAILLFTHTLYKNAPATSSLPHLPHDSPIKSSIANTTNATDDSIHDAPSRMATQLSPKALMSRPLPTDLTKVPRLFHQFWSEPDLPVKFEAWTENCREKNPEWEWVLWNVDDALELVEKFVPWFLETYRKLEAEHVVYRADILRNMYLHIFGGVYADLDTDCLRGWDGAITEYKEPGYRQVFLARMGMDNNFGQSIPNAWMASTPGHPFWLLPLEYLDAHVGNGARPEENTGPGALKVCADEYQEKYREDTEALDQLYAASGWRSLFQNNDHSRSHTHDHNSYNNPSTPSRTSITSTAQTLTILPQWEIFPYSWAGDGLSVQPWCSTQRSTFNATRCKELLAVEAWGSYSISYFSHSWGSSGDMDLVGVTEKEMEENSKAEEGVREEDERGRQMGVQFDGASGRKFQKKRIR